MHLWLALALTIAAEPPMQEVPQPTMLAAHPAVREDDSAVISAEEGRFRLEFLQLGAASYGGVTEIGSGFADDGGGLLLGAALLRRQRALEFGAAAALTSQLIGGPSLLRTSLLAGVSLPLGAGSRPRVRVELHGEAGHSWIDGIGSNPFEGSGLSASATRYFVGGRAGLSIRLHAGTHDVALGVGATFAQDLGTTTTSDGRASYRVGGTFSSAYFRLGVEP